MNFKSGYAVLPLTVVLLVVLAGFAVAQDPTRPTSISNGIELGENEAASISGTVRSITGEMIPRASLRLTGRPNPEALRAGSRPPIYEAASDSEGNFTFQNLAPGEYQLIAERTGFVRLIYRANDGGVTTTPIRLSAGEDRTGVELTMTPQAVITGIVTDQAGDPVERVRVQALMRRYGAGSEMGTAASVTTNDIGEYRLSGLTEGEYFLVAAESQTGLPGFIQNGNANQTISRVATFYPGTENLSGAVPVRAASGMELSGIDIRMVERETFSVSGTVVDGVTGNVATTFVRLIQPDAAVSLPFINNQQVVRPPDGTFRFSGLTPGTYRIENGPTGRINGQEVTGGVGRLEFTIVDQDITGLVMTLGPGATITGTVTLEEGDLADLLSGSKVPQANSVAGAVSRGPRIQLYTLEQSPVTPTPSVVASPAGEFEFTGLPAEQYRVYGNSLPPGTYLKSARFNGQDVTDTMIDLSSGAGGSLEIVLSDQAGELSGVVQSDDVETLQGMPVVLWPDISDGQRILRELRFLSAGPGGQFQFPGLAPGKYFIAAWESSDMGLVRAPEFLAQFTGDAEEIEVTEGSSQSVTIDLIPDEEVEAARQRMP